MDHRVVHEQHDRLFRRARVSSYGSQGMIDEVLKDAGVNSALDQLSGDHLVLADGRYQRHGVRLPLDQTFTVRQLEAPEPVLA